MQASSNCSPSTFRPCDGDECDMVLPCVRIPRMAMRSKMRLHGVLGESKIDEGNLSIRLLYSSKRFVLKSRVFKNSLPRASLFHRFSLLLRKRECLPCLLY